MAIAYGSQEGQAREAAKEPVKETGHNAASIVATRATLPHSAGHRVLSLQIGHVSNADKTWHVALNCKAPSGSVKHVDEEYLDYNMMVGFEEDVEGREGSFPLPATAYLGMPKGDEEGPWQKAKHVHLQRKGL